MQTLSFQVFTENNKKRFLNLISNVLSFNLPDWVSNKAYVVV